MWGPGRDPALDKRPIGARIPGVTENASFMPVVKRLARGWELFDGEVLGMGTAFEAAMDAKARPG
jgi:hypothetical protein